MIKKLLNVFVACWLTVVVNTASAESKIGFRQLAPTTPVAIQRGTKRTLNVRSNFTLDRTHSVFFGRPGITATFLETKPIDAPRRGRGRPGTAFRFEFDVPADQEPGVYEFRVATAQAVSSCAHIYVSDYPVVDEENKENGTPATAQVVKFPVCVAGTTEKTEDVDCYQVRAAAGQELTFQVFAQRVTRAVHSMQSGNGSYLMDPILTLYSPTGQVVAQNDNFDGAESFIAYTIPEDGDYTIEVRDARYIGNAKYVYCVEISNRPYVHAVFPLAVQRGTSADVQVVGHNLGGMQSTTISAASDHAVGWKDFRIATPKGHTNPIGIFISEHPQILGASKGNAVETAQSLTLPVGISGRLAERDQVHYYSFETKQGQYYLFEITAKRRGLPLDSVLEIYNADGKKLTESDDGLQTQDSKLYYKAPADGTFVLAVRDLHDRGGERYIYHLKAEPSSPDFEVQGEYYYSQLAPGTRMMWFARVNRLNGFTGPVEMHIDRLPQGVTLEPVTIPAGMNHCGLILSAAPDAKINASLVEVYGTAEIPGPDGKPHRIRRDGRITCELQTQGGGQARTEIQTSIIGVTEPLDLLEVIADPSEIVLKPGGKAEIKVRVKRDKEFKDPITLAMQFKYFSSILGNQLPPGITVSKTSKARLTGKVAEGTIILEASDKASVLQRFPMAVLARVSITFSITTNYASNPIYLTIEK